MSEHGGAAATRPLLLSDPRAARWLNPLALVLGGLALVASLWVYAMRSALITPTIDRGLVQPMLIVLPALSAVLVGFGAGRMARTKRFGTTLAGIAGLVTLAFFITDLRILTAFRATQRADDWILIVALVAQIAICCALVPFVVAIRAPFAPASLPRVTAWIGVAGALVAAWFLMTLSGRSSLWMILGRGIIPDIGPTVMLLLLALACGGCLLLARNDPRAMFVGGGLILVVTALFGTPGLIQPLALGGSFASAAAFPLATAGIGIPTVLAATFFAVAVRARPEPNATGANLPPSWEHAAPVSTAYPTSDPGYDPAPRATADPSPTHKTPAFRRSERKRRPFE